MAYIRHGANSTHIPLAGGSFTLYAAHEPLLAFARENFPNVVQNYNLGLSSLAIIMLVAYGLAEIGERPKIIYKSFVAKCMSSRKNH